VFSLSSRLIVITEIIVYLVNTDIEMLCFVINAVRNVTGVFGYIFHVFLLIYRISGIGGFKLRAIKEWFGRSGVKISFDSAENINGYSRIWGIIMRNWEYYKLKFLMTASYNNIVKRGRIDSQMHSAKSNPFKYPVIVSSYHT
jgi:hypothetical protein